jgi:GWxTD domain-containing protein
MNKILIAFLFFSSIILSQVSVKHSTLAKKNILSEIFSLKKDSTFRTYYFFKIPFSSLVFQKDNSKFLSRFEILLEISNSNQQIVHRIFKNNQVEIFDFEKSISERDFIYDFLSFDSNADSFVCNVTFTDLLSGNSFEIFKQNIDLVNSSERFNWLLSKSNSNSSIVEFDIEIYSKKIPHSSSNYDMIIIGNSDITDVSSIVVKAKDSIVSKIQFDKLYAIEPQLKLIDNRIRVALKSEDQVNNAKSVLIAKNINANLYEGDYTIVLLKNNSDVIREIPLSVQWYNKPNSLMDYNLALEMIEYIEEGKSYKSFFGSQLDKQNKLISYWKSKDPTPGTAFNELMNEFYSRIDFAQNEFISVSQRNGAKTDRGKIYILNGKPDKVERSVNVDGKIVETWNYDKPIRIFSFIDFRGDGNFKLIK